MANSVHIARTYFIRTLFTATIVLAMALTLSCSSDNDNPPSGDTSSQSGGSDINSSSGGNPSSGGGGGSSSSAVSSSGTGGSSSSSVGGGVSSSSVGGGGSSSSTTTAAAIEPCPNATTTPVNAEGVGSVTCGGKPYKTIKIGEQVWFAENLNYAVEGSKCYNNLDSNCDIYGRLYDWATAMGIPSTYNTTLYNPSPSVKYRGVCPQGWHIPNDAEWNELMNYVGGDVGLYGSPTAGRKLKAKNGWKDCGPVDSGKKYVCSDEYDFSALPSGEGSSDGHFDNASYEGYWLNASEGNIYFISCLGMSYSQEKTFWYGGNKSNLFSVRCLQD